MSHAFLPGLKISLRIWTDELSARYLILSITGSSEGTKNDMEIYVRMLVKKEKQVMSIKIIMKRSFILNGLSDSTGS